MAENLKGPFTQAIFVAQLNVIFVALKLQLQYRTCKPAAIQRDLSAIYRRDLQNTVTLSSSFATAQTHTFCFGLSFFSFCFVLLQSRFVLFQFCFVSFYNSAKTSN